MADSTFLRRHGLPKPMWMLRAPNEMVGRCYRLVEVDARLQRWGFRRKDIVQVTEFNPLSPRIVFIVVPGFPDQTSFVYTKWLGEEVHPLLALASAERG